MKQNRSKMGDERQDQEVGENRVRLRSTAYNMTLCGRMGGTNPLKSEMLPQRSKNNANEVQPYQCAAAGQGRWLLFRRRGRVIRQLPAPLPLEINLSGTSILASRLTENLYPAASIGNG